MLNTTKLSPEWQALATENEVAHLRADICLSDPDSYTLAEKPDRCRVPGRRTEELRAAQDEPVADVDPGAPREDE